MRLRRAWTLAELLGWHDPGDIFAAFGLPAVWGLLAVGFFAPAPGQFKAQVIGVVSIFLLTFFVTSVFLAVMALFTRLTLGRTQPDPMPEADPDAILPEL